MSTEIQSLMAKIYCIKWLIKYELEQKAKWQAVMYFFEGEVVQKSEKKQTKSYHHAKGPLSLTMASQ